MARRDPEAPADELLAWLSTVVGNGSVVTAVRRRASTGVNSVYAVDLARGQRITHLIVKRYPTESRDYQRAAVAREAQHLAMLESAKVPSPPLVAVDVDGEYGGQASVIMQRLPGQVIMQPPNMHGWLRGMAAQLPLIHGFSPPAEWPKRAYRPYYEVAGVTTPEWATDPTAWERAIGYVRDRPLPSGSRFIHRDFHPGNILWKADAVSAVVDWEPASWGPPGFDVAHCRLNVALVHGVVAADALLDAYQMVVPGFQHDPHLDLLAAFEVLCEPGQWPGGTRPMQRRALETYVVDLARLI